MTTNSQHIKLTQPEAALAEGIGQSPTVLDYSDDGRLVDLLSGTLLQDFPEERDFPFELMYASGRLASHVLEDVS